VKSILASFPGGLAVGASIAAVLAAAAGLYRWSVLWYRRTIGSRRDLTRRFNQLAAGVTTRWVEERLGAPAFTRGTDLAVAGRQAVTELIYRTRHAWVQVLTDRDDAVVRFSITVTDPRFRFKTRDLTHHHLDVKLGRSRFADVRVAFGDTKGCSLRVGAHNYEYSEAYYFGNPGNYQHYVLSNNDIGAGIFDASAGGGPQWCQEGVLRFKDPTRPELPVFDPKAAYAAKFRANTTINTLTVLGPWRKLADLAEPRGPDSNHVRVLLADSRERRRRRRLVRQWNRRVLRVAKRQALNLSRAGGSGGSG
jgi:hypothetical protein